MNMDSEDGHEDYPWADFFMASSNPYYGWVRDLEAAQAVVTEYSFATSIDLQLKTIIICCDYHRG
jgi:hypothetical protein